MDILSLKAKLFSALLMTGIILVQSVNAAGNASGEEPGFSRIAVVHDHIKPDRGGNHYEDFDYALQQLNWKADRYVSTQEGMRELTKSLDKYDLILVVPLFNYYKTIDQSASGPAIRKFIEDGGVMMISDALYPEIYNSLLTAIDSGLAIGEEPCHATRDVQHSADNSLYFLPNLLRESNSWGHLKLPENTGWEIIARCGDGSPYGVQKRLGKGFIFLSGCRLYTPEWLENLQVNQAAAKQGFSVTKFIRPQFSIGKGAIHIALKNILPAVNEGSLIFRYKTVKSDWKEFSDSFRLASDESIGLELPFEIADRGKIQAELELRSGNRSARIMALPAVVPPLLTVTGPAYRSFAPIAELKKNGRITVTADVVPYREQLSDLKLDVKIVNSSRIAVAWSGEIGIDKKHFRCMLEAKELKPGEYRIIAELFHKGKSSAKSEAPLHVLAESECPVYINENRNLVTDGKEFFPIGIYHINPQDMVQAAAIGFNTVHSWDIEEAFTVPAQYGMKVLWEQNHRGSGADWVGEKAARVGKTYSNALIWYGLDEPNATQHEFAKKIHDFYHRFDKGHPTYVVSCYPELFPQQAEFGDIFAVDPYPFPDKPVGMVADWMDRAWAAVKGDKPVFCIPQSFGVETPEALRVMTYLAIIHEARGIIWYPWDDGPNDARPNGGTGLKYAKHLHPVMQQLVLEIKSLSPLLLNPNRKQVKFADGKVHGLLCENNGTRILLLANPEKYPVQVKLDTLTELAGKLKLKKAFAAGEVKVAEPLTMPPYGTQALILTGQIFTEEKKSLESLLQKTQGLAYQCKVTASSQGDPSMVPANVVDGNPKTRWESPALNPAWIMLDFGSSKTFQHIRLHWENAYSTEYRIQASDDAENWKDIFVRNSGKGKVEEIQLETPATARYLRLLCEKRIREDWGQSLWEIQVFEKNAGEAFSPSQENKVIPGNAKMDKFLATGNLALIAEASASSQGDPSMIPANAIDDNLNSRWESPALNPAWIMLDFGSSKTFQHIRLHWENAYSTEYRIQASDDAENWKDIFVRNSGKGKVEEIQLETPATARYLRLLCEKRIREDWGQSLWEIQVFEK